MGRNPSKSAGNKGTVPKASAKVEAPGQGTTVGSAEMARILGITPVWLRTLAKTGEIPKPIRTNPASIWDVATTVRGYIATIKRGESNAEESVAATQKSADLALTIARQRKTELEASLAAKELQRAEGSLVDRDEVAATWADIASTVRTRVLTAPAKVAPRILALRNAAEIEAVIRRELEESLDELSRASVEFVPADAAEPESKSTDRGRAPRVSASA